MQTEPWGKLDRAHPDRASAPRLSLVAHCIDVAAVTRALLDLPLWRLRMDRLAGRTLSARDLDRLTVLAFLHDAGKAGAGFYSKGLADAVASEWRRRWDVDGRQCGHTRVVAPLLRFEGRYEPHREALGVDALRAWAGDDVEAQHETLNLWMAAVSHHGEPISADDLQHTTGGFPTWTEPIAGYEPLQGLRSLQAVARELWPAAYADDAPWPGPAQPLIHGFAGLVSLADWIGSNTAPSFFPFNLGPQDSSRWRVSLPRARQILRDMRIDLEASRADLRQRAPSFASVFGFEPSAVQKATATAPLSSPLVLEAETGSGKTEAALWRFKALFEAGEVDALCFLLPTRVAATGIFERLERFIAALFPHPALRPNTVLAVPGYLHANGEDGTQLPHFEVQWPDGDVRRPLYWAAEHSKRYFAAAAAAATIDQFLLSTLQTKHAHLRGSVLLRSLVVVDEVHASDTYMRTLLVRALKRHLAAGGHALLLSATLTRDMRGELLAAAPAAGPARRRFGASVPVSSVAQMPTASDHYPLLSTPGLSQACEAGAYRKLIRHTLEPLMRDAEAVASLAAQAALAGARVLVLRNTVKQAVATQRALEHLLGSDHPVLFRCRGVVSLHHGRFALPDRKALDAAVSEQFGKSAARSPAAVVLCATQTVEISVDCDADFMITDLAPMDVLLQRLGRLHRHETRRSCRPAGFETARCCVLTPPDRDLSRLWGRAGAQGLGLGGQSAYPDVTCLEATLRALESRSALHIPEDNRELVESACGATALAELANALGEPWPAHRAELLAKAGAHRGMALFQSIDWQKPWRDAVPGELNTEAKTRLGLDGIQLDLPAPQATPFGYAITQITVPAWMLPPQDDAASLPEVERFVAAPGAFGFAIRGRGFVYDRFGLAVADQ